MLLLRSIGQRRVRTVATEWEANSKRGHSAAPHRFTPITIVSRSWSALAAQARLLQGKGIEQFVDLALAVGERVETDADLVE